MICTPFDTFWFFRDPNLDFAQEMMFGSNELIYVPGSPLPIMIEEEEEEELEEEQEKLEETPAVPPRSKVSKRARGVCDSPEQSLPAPASPDYEVLSPPTRNKTKPSLANIAFPESDQPPPPPPCPHTFPRTKKLKVDSDALVSPPPRKYATVQRKEVAKSNVSVSFVFVVFI